MEDYELKKESNYKYQVLKNGKPAYELQKRGSKWACSCTGFKYRGTCKHVKMLEEQLGQEPEQLHGIFARVAQLQKSYDLWKQRYEENPSKVNERNMNNRKAQLEEAKQKAEEEKKNPTVRRHPREEFEPYVPKLEEVFKGLGKWELVGSWRRGKKDFHDLDCLICCNKSDFKKVFERLSSDHEYVPTITGDEIIRGKYKGYDFDINRVEPDEWGSQLLYRTGSAAFNVAMRGWLKKSGWSLNEHGVFNEKGEKLASKTEEDMFRAMGLPFIKPEDRENPGSYRKYFRGVPGQKKVGDSIVKDKDSYDDFIIELMIDLEDLRTKKRKFSISYNCFELDGISTEVLIRMKPTNRITKKDVNPLITLCISEAGDSKDVLFEGDVPMDEVVSTVEKECYSFIFDSDAAKVADTLNKNLNVNCKVLVKPGSTIFVMDTGVAWVTKDKIRTNCPLIVDNLLKFIYPGRFMDLISIQDCKLCQKIIDSK